MLGNAETLAAQSEALFPALLEFRWAYHKANHDVDFLQHYSETLIGNSVRLMTYTNGRLSAIMQNALDFAAHIAVSFSDKMQLLQFQPFNAQYLSLCIEASINTEIGLILGDYAIENTISGEEQIRIADFLKMSYERFGAYALLLGLWEIPAHETPQYMVNMRIVSRVLTSKKAPYLHA